MVLGDERPDSRSGHAGLAHRERVVPAVGDHLASIELRSALDTHAGMACGQPPPARLMLAAGELLFRGIPALLMHLDPRAAAARARLAGISSATRTSGHRKHGGTIHLTRQRTRRGGGPAGVTEPSWP
jgi:hypothetical protein